MTERRYLTNLARDYLKKGDLVLAALRVAVDLEQVLFEKLFFEKKINSELMSGWTLGTYVRWNISLGLIDKKYGSLLNQFNRLRNLLVHRRNFIEDCKNREESKKLINDAILSVCNFIDSTKISYQFSQEIENNYMKLFEKEKNEFESFLAQDYNSFLEEENKNV